MTRAFRILFLLTVLVPTARIAPAQGPATGTPPFGSFSGGPESINNANLNVHWTIPVLHKPGRGTDFTYDLSYDSSVWYPVGSSGNQTWQAVANFGWKGVTEIATGYVSFSAHTGVCQGDNGPEHYTYNDTWVYHDPFGTSHSFVNLTILVGADIWACSGLSRSGTDTAADDSGYTMTATGNTATVTSAAGTVYHPPINNNSGAASFTDRNGNQITVNGSGVFTDTLNKSALTVSGTAPSNTVFTYTTSTGGSAFYTMKYTTYTVRTNFGCTGITDFDTAGTTQYSLVSEIDLPDGVSAYTFTYETTPLDTHNPHHVTGRLASVTLPTGGTISYTYTGGSSGNIACADGSASGFTRQTPDGTWTYARSGSTTTITAPQLSYDSAANNTVLTFSGLQEASRKIYQGAATGTPLRTINTAWASNGTPNLVTTILEDGSTQATTATTYDSFGNLDSATEYDWGAGAHGPAVRATTNTYLSYIPVFPTRIVISDGTGAVKSRTDIAYDNYTSPYTMTCRTTPIAQHDDTNHGCTFTARGNPTSTTTYTDPVTPGGATTKYTSYDQLGNVVGADVNCCQRKTWIYSTTTNYAYADSVTSGSSAPQLTTSFTYDLNMGLVLTSTDPNNLKTTFAYDGSGRVTSVQPTTSPATPATTYTYNDYNNGTTFTPWTSQVCAPVQSTSTVCQKSILDKEGRRSTQQILDGGSTLYSATDTKYDALGRAFKDSNPYTGSASYWTETRTDALGRTLRIILPDASANIAAYTTNSVTTTDPTGNQRKSASDALGRMTSVWEPDPTNGNTLTLQTFYAYNLFDALTTVTQGSQTRTYAYDALGRISSATTPEAGRLCFGSVTGSTCNADGYDSFNNLLKRTDARGVLTTFGYDSLNRLQSITYNVGSTGVPATASVSYTYGIDTSCNTPHGAGCIGRLITMTDGVGSENYTFNTLGQVTQLQKVIGSSTYTTQYAYNYSGELTQITYPSSRIVVPSYDAIGRPCAVGTSGSTCTTGTLYASGFGFNPAQQVTGFKYGNGLFASFGFSSDRLQLNCLDYSTTNRSGTCAHDSTTKFGLSYSYGTSGSNNGQIGGITDSVDAGRNATYAYDSLYRLTNASTAGSTNYPAWGLSETYDRYGNRGTQNTSSGCSGITCPTNSVTISTATNQISGSPYAYDASGNMTNDGQNTLVFDGENHAVSATVTGSSSGTYTYDGNGLRIQRVSVISGTTTTTVYVFSGSKVIAEYVNGALPSAPTREYIYAGAALLAKIDSSGTKYYHQDHLSNRLVTDSSGNASEQMGHFPFGESWYNATSDKLLFTSYERDSESGNDYAMARFYVNRLARFSSPDPLAGSTASPQSLNRYSYVLNAPTSLVDPAGMDPCNDAMYDANRHKLRRHILVAGLGPFDLEESDLEPQDLGEGCIDGGGGGTGDPPLDPNNPGSDCNSPYVGCVSADAPNIPPDDPSAPPDFGSPDFGPNPFPMPNVQPTDPCAGFVRPVNAQVTTPYGARDPMHQTAAGHSGDDYRVPIGTQVVAPFSGTVSVAPGAGFGIGVLITNPNGRYILGHLSSTSVVPGQYVSAGDPVGLSGNTGTSSGPHLHFQQHGPNGPLYVARNTPNPANIQQPCR
jgi:RHS repeat-associated protein